MRVYCIDYLHPVDLDTEPRGDERCPQCGCPTFRSADAPPTTMRVDTQVPYAPAVSSWVGGLVKETVHADPSPHPKQ